MPSKRDTQIQREREMRARLGWWLDVAAALPPNGLDTLWFSGGIAVLRGLVFYRPAHLPEAVLLDMAAECDLNLRSREAAADIARSAAA
jgi:hypothetical protein